MLKKILRLQKENNVSNIITRGETNISPLLVAKVRKNAKRYCRFSVIVSGKIFKKATKRNRLRRQIYEAIRIQIECTHHTQHYDFAFLARKNILEKTYKEIEKCVKQILNYL